MSSTVVVPDVGDAVGLFGAGGSAGCFFADDLALTDVDVVFFAAFLAVFFTGFFFLVRPAFFVGLRAAFAMS
jgi:hypothetical protein